MSKSRSKTKKQRKVRRMRDKIKCRIIDAMLMGEDIFIIRIYEGSALATHDSEELFCWRHHYGEWDKRLMPTLKEALQIVDDCWDERIEPMRLLDEPIV